MGTGSPQENATKQSPSGHKCRLRARDERPIGAHRARPAGGIGGDYFADDCPVRPVIFGAVTDLRPDLGECIRQPHAFELPPARATFYVLRLDLLQAYFAPFRPPPGETVFLGYKVTAGDLAEARSLDKKSIP